MSSDMLTWIIKTKKIARPRSTSTPSGRAQLRGVITHFASELPIVCLRRSVPTALDDRDRCLMNIKPNILSVVHEGAPFCR